MVREIGSGFGARLRTTHPIVIAGLAMVAAQLLFRLWVVAGGWFYGDDLELHRVAMVRTFDWDYLTAVHSGHLMPVGRALVELSVAGGSMNWPLTVGIILSLQAAVSLAGLWALLVLFGRRSATLGLLAIYLASAVTLPATAWWSAVLNQLPHQVGLWIAIGAWVNYERGHNRRWLALTLAGLGIALLTDVRGVFVLPVLAVMSLGWFAEGSLSSRVSTVLVRHGKLLAATLPLLLGYAYFYTSISDDVTVRPSWHLVGSLANKMLGEAFVVGVLGGPWRWTNPFPPTPFADPPTVAVHLAWVVITLLLVHVTLTRRGALKAFLLTGVYLLMLFFVLLTSRAPLVGSLIGAEYRYLTDAAAMMVVSVGLAYLPLRGAAGSSTPRPRPAFVGQIPHWLAPSLVGLVVIGGVVSSIGYAVRWHDTNQARTFVENLRSDLAEHEPVDLSAGLIPEEVISPLIWREDALPNLTTLLGAEADFPDATDRLAMVNRDGHLKSAWIDAGVVARPGPVPECGWKIDHGSLRIPLTSEAFEHPWWLRIGYLAPHDAPVTIRAGRTRVATTLKAGMNSLYVKNVGGFDNVSIGGLRQGVTVCVDRIEVGKAIPGGALR